MFAVSTSSGNRYTRRARSVRTMPLARVPRLCLHPGGRGLRLALLPSFPCALGRIEGQLPVIPTSLSKAPMKGVGVSAWSRPAGGIGRPCVGAADDADATARGGVAPRHHAGHPRESGHTQTAVALVTTLCKLQLAVGPRAFSKDIYLAGRQTSFMFWVFFLREEIPPSLTKNKHLCYAISWRPDWGAAPAPPAPAWISRPHPMTPRTLRVSSGIRPGIGTTPHSNGGRAARGAPCSRDRGL